MTRKRKFMPSPPQQLSLWRKIYAALRCVGRPIFVTGRQNTLTEHTLTVRDSQARIPLDFLLPEMCALRQYMHNRKLAETSNRTTELSMKELRSSGSRQAAWRSWPDFWNVG